MLDSVRKHVAIPYVPGKVLLSAAPSPASAGCWRMT